MLRCGFSRHPHHPHPDNIAGQFHQFSSSISSLKTELNNLLIKNLKVWRSVGPLSKKKSGKTASTTLFLYVQQLLCCKWGIKSCPTAAQTKRGNKNITDHYVTPASLNISLSPTFDAKVVCRSPFFFLFLFPTVETSQIITPSWASTHFTWLKATECFLLWDPVGFLSTFSSWN